MAETDSKTPLLEVKNLVNIFLSLEVLLSEL